MQHKPDKLLLATENLAKSRELGAILARLLGTSTTVLNLRDIDQVVEFPEEIGTSFCQIAATKALAASQATGLVCLGDDSGLCVDILDGAPGVRSKRWAPGARNDSERNSALLDALSQHPRQRTAQFVTCAAICFPDGTTTTAIGECHGKIINSPRGDNGFGYDPLFEVAMFGLTMAELTSEQKNEISHRAKAIKNLLFKLGWITA